jgi:hypothetical protein
LARRHKCYLRTFLLLAPSHRAVRSAKQAGTSNTVTSSKQIEIEKSIRRKYLRKEAARQGSRKKVYSITSAIMIKLWRFGKFMKYRLAANAFLAADRTDGSRWAAAVEQPSPEADERASWIGRGARSAQLHPVRDTVF